jgi:hypothetical protein
MNETLYRPTEKGTLALIRDYEAQIALYKIRIEMLEQTERELHSRLNLYGQMMADPETMKKNLTLAGLPIMEVRGIYELLDEWHRNGGTQQLVDWLAAE